MANNHSRTEGLRDTTAAFCQAFITGCPSSETLDKYFTRNARILEHGPIWAKERLPFLATTFKGRRSSANAASQTTCDDYYDLLTSTLSFHPNSDSLPPKEAFMVDGEMGTVTIKLHAEFASVKTGKGWEEDFIYVLSDFDEDMKIGSQELWADPLSAWMAVSE